MEVHHHPDLHHKKKKWKEYFSEFIMMFLAVTLGFFAETIREHISENHREKDYIKGLVNNIKDDTLALQGLIERNDDELKRIDTLMGMSKEDFLNTAVHDSIFFYAVAYTISLHLFEYNDLTLVQLRNAGGYSLIRKGSTADSIARYESRNNDIKLQEKFVTDYYGQTWAAFKQVFDGALAREFYKAYLGTNKIPTNIGALISPDPVKMHVLFNNYWTFAIVLTGYNNLLYQHREYLRRLIVFLKETYDID